MSQPLAINTELSPIITPSSSVSNNFISPKDNIFLNLNGGIKKNTPSQILDNLTSLVINLQKKKSASTSTIRHSSLNDSITIKQKSIKSKQDEDCIPQNYDFIEFNEYMPEGNNRSSAEKSQENDENKLREDLTNSRIHKRSYSQPNNTNGFLRFEHSVSQGKTDLALNIDDYDEKLLENQNLADEIKTLKAELLNMTKRFSALNRENFNLHQKIENQNYIISGLEKSLAENSMLPIYAKAEIELKARLLKLEEELQEKDDCIEKLKEMTQSLSATQSVKRALGQESEYQDKEHISKVERLLELMKGKNEEIKRLQNAEKKSQGDIEELKLKLKMYSYSSQKEELKDENFNEEEQIVNSLNQYVKEHKNRNYCILNDYKYNDSEYIKNESELKSTAEKSIYSKILEGFSLNNINNYAKSDKKPKSVKKVPTYIKFTDAKKSHSPKRESYKESKERSPKTPGKPTLSSKKSKSTSENSKNFLYGLQREYKAKVDNFIESNEANIEHNNVLRTELLNHFRKCKGEAKKESDKNMFSSSVEKAKIQPSSANNKSLMRNNSLNSNRLYNVFPKDSKGKAKPAYKNSFKNLSVNMDGLKTNMFLSIGNKFEIIQNNYKR